MNPSLFMRRLLIVAALAVPALQAIAADTPIAAGTVTMLTGRGTAADSEGNIRALIKGGAVYSGEIINSGSATYINLPFSDGGLVLLRPKTRFQIADYRNVPAPAAAAPEAAPENKPATPAAASPAPTKLALATPGPGSHAFFRLLKGGFRAVSGAIGHVNHDDYEVDSPVATIGIRGTDFTAVICDEACANDPVIAASLPAGATGAGSLVTSVTKGKVVVGTQGKCSASGQKRDDCSEIDAGQYHMTTSTGQQVNLPSEPRFMRVDPLPNPQMCAG